MSGPSDDARTISHLRADLGTHDALVLLFDDGHHQIALKAKKSTAWHYAPLTRTDQSSGAVDP